MKFLADMGISPQSVAFLRHRGIEAVHLHELGLIRLSDADIVEKARRDGYVTLTHDLDFGELVAVSGAEVPSVVILRLQDMRPHSVNSRPRIPVTEHQTALEQGAIVSVSEEHIRVRMLPVA